MRPDPARSRELLVCTVRTVRTYKLRMDKNQFLMNFNDNGRNHSIFDTLKFNLYEILIVLHYLTYFTYI